MTSYQRCPGDSQVQAYEDGSFTIDGVVFRRHPNGGGLVAETASVDDTAFVGMNAWVYEKAKVYGNAKVFGDAWVSRGKHASGRVAT